MEFFDKFLSIEENVARAKQGDLRHRLLFLRYAGAIEKAPLPGNAGLYDIRIADRAHGLTESERHVLFVFREEVLNELYRSGFEGLRRVISTSSEVVFDAIERGLFQPRRKNRRALISEGGDLDDQGIKDQHVADPRGPVVAELLREFVQSQPGVFDGITILVFVVRAQTLRPAKSVSTRSPLARSFSASQVETAQCS